MVFFFLLFLTAVAMLIAGSQIETKYTDNVLCIKHVWRRRDAKGWLPDPCDDFERVQKAPLTCATCGVIVRADTFNSKEEE